MPKQSRFLRAIVSFALLGLAAWAQDRPSAPVSNTSAPNLQVQKIGANDLVALSVYDAPEMSRTYRVGPTGQLHLPMLKTRITAEGLLPAELEEAIAAALDREKILVHPVVTVTMAEYASRPISVAGAVKTPLKFQAIGNVTLLDAIARAGGLSPEAGSEILLTLARTGKDGEPGLVRRIPVKSLIDEADPLFNVMLTGGEEVRVPESGKVFVVGNVKKPGAYPIGGKNECTLLKALAYAEGLMPFAQNTAYIYRRDDGGVKHDIPVELSKIMSRKSPDVVLLPNDILYIPDNATKRMTTGVIEKALGFSSATASGLLVWRR